MRSISRYDQESTIGNPEGAVGLPPARPGNGSPGVPAVSSVNGKSPNKDPMAAQLDALQQLTRRQLELIGENPSREGLRATPARVATAFSQLTSGYTLDVHEVVRGAIYEEDHRGMILVRDIEMYSLCEHHLLPMFGRVHIAYVPDGTLIGPSKLPHLVDVFARRLQLQERLTQQITDAVEDVLQPRGVAVLIDAVHLCMMMRGIEKQSSSCMTTSFRGTLLDDHHAREEFYRLVRGRSRG